MRLKINKDNFHEYIHIIPHDNNLYTFVPRPNLSIKLKEIGSTVYDYIAPVVVEVLNPVRISTDNISHEVMAEVPRLKDYLK